MKKYIKPDTQTVTVETSTILVGSGSIISGGLDDNLGYGGTDTDGSKDPQAKEFFSTPWSD